MIITFLCIIMGHMFSSEFTYIAHRAADKSMPENTIDSMQRMHQKGATCFEIDCYLMRDGNIAVIHDEDLKRTTTGKGKITKMTSIDLLDVFVIGGSGAERIPMLYTLMDYVAENRLSLMIEVKDKNLAIVEKIDTLIKTYPTGHFAIYSFDETTVEAFARIKPNYPIHWNMKRLTKVRLQKAKDLGIGINLDGRYATPSAIEKVKSLGKKMHIYTVNCPDEAMRFLELGVDAIITDTLFGGV